MSLVYGYLLYVREEGAHDHSASSAGELRGGGASILFRIYASLDYGAGESGTMGLGRQRDRLMTGGEALLPTLAHYRVSRCGWTSLRNG